MALNIVSSTDGPRITVNDFVRDPLLIPQFVLRMAAQEFIADTVLRNGGTTQSGSVKYFDTTPLYSGSNVAVRSEGGEVPVSMNSLGTPRVAFVEERALAIQVTDEMIRRMTIDPVNFQMTQVLNTMTKSWDDTFFQALLNAVGVNTYAGLGAWGSNTNVNTNVYADLAEAVRLIVTSTDSNGNRLGYDPDTLIIGPNTRADLFKNTNFNQVYRGNAASSNLNIRGLLPQQIQGLDVIVSRRLAPGLAVVMQRGVTGFIADELPLQATALYRDEPRKTFRSDVQRASAVGIDQPKSATIISGV